MGMSLAEKKADLIERLNFLPTPQDRLMYVMDLAKKQGNLPPEYRTDPFRVEGCLSSLWFVPRIEQGRCFFQCDADSQVVKGIARLLTEFYSGAAPREILEHDPSFLGEAGITQHLSPNRRNGLSRLWDKISAFAREHLEQA